MLEKIFKYWIYWLAGTFFLGLFGCQSITTKGNSEFYFRYGTEIAIGQRVHDTNENQVAETAIEYGPLLDFILPNDGSEEGPNPEAGGNE